MVIPSTLATLSLGDAFDVSWWQRHLRLPLATPRAPRAGDARGGQTVDFTSTSTLTLAQVVARGGEGLQVSPCHPRGAFRMADGTFPHLTGS